MRRKQLIAAAAVPALIAWIAVSAGASGNPGPQQGANQDRSRPLLATTLWHTFTTSTDGGTTFRVSNEGNVYSIESPTGYEHVDVGLTEEGYLLCYTPFGMSEVQNYDLAFGSAGFGAATHSSVAPWTVTRNTSDGRMQLKQVFTFNGTSKSLTVAMTVKNLTGATVSDVIVARVADFDVDVGGASGFADYSDNWFAATNAAVFAWNTGSHGLVLRHLKQATGATRNALMPSAPDSCHSGGTSGPTQGDQVAYVSYLVGNVAAGASKTVTIQYVRD